LVPRLSRIPEVAVRPVDVIGVAADGSRTKRDVAAAEEPLQIRLGGSPFVVIMRTPGADRELAAGFLLSEQIVRSSEDIAAIRPCTDDKGEEQTNILNVWLTGEAAERAATRLADRRLVTANSACGICGRKSIDDLMESARHVSWRGPCQVRVGEPDKARPTISRGPTICRDVISALPTGLRAAQTGFDESGGLHAAGLFDPDGSLVAVAEDVGRHNAVDKVIGAQTLLNRLPLDDAILFVSGRTSFEIVQKAVVAGIPIVAAVSAPSSLAVDLAHESGTTLIGFVRGSTFNIYAGAERIVL
jgi:FdhD protein